MSATGDSRTVQAELARLARSAGGRGEPARLSERSGGLVIALGEVVAKAHPPGTSRAALQARVDAARSAPLAGLVLAPLHPHVLDAGDRLATAWPRGEPVAGDDPEAAPWEEAACLLARLHATPPSADPALARLPAAGGPARLERALARLDAQPDSAAKRDVRAAASTLPAARAGAALVHGDWHLGQLVRAPGAAMPPWRLIDIDDLGLGDPAWDLARPAALYAAGLVLEPEWQRFLGAYRAAGGTAVAATGDPWPTLDGPARALAVQLAATALVAAAREGRALDESGEMMVSGCRRIARVIGGRRLS